MQPEPDKSSETVISGGCQNPSYQGPETRISFLSDLNQIIVLIIPEENYTERLINIVKEMNQLDGKICYISLNRPYNSLLTSFKKAGINTDNIYVIDAITRTAQLALKCDNCEFVSSPGALTELSVTISNLMETGRFKYIIFDSLSTLLVYESDNTIAKFVHFLMAKVRVVGCNAIFTCLKQDADSILVKDINMFADKVINFEKWQFRA